MNYRITIFCWLAFLMTGCGQYGALHLPGTEKTKIHGHQNPPSITAVVESDSP